MKTEIRLGITLVVIACSAGCASGYKEFYKPSQGATPEAIAARRAGPPPTAPLVERAQPGDGQAIVDAYGKRGYVMIGQSMFNSGRPEPEEAAVNQAKAVGADLVLILDARYTGSVTSSIPITTPTTTTSYTSGSATAYGPGGPVTAYGTGTTTTYGTTTSYVPMTIHRSDYGAVFFVKQRFGFGTFSRELSNPERQAIQSNKGAVVTVVVDGSPAFNADILVGDIIVSLNGTEIINRDMMNEMLRANSGRSVTVGLIRQGKKIEKSVQLGL